MKFQHKPVMVNSETEQRKSHQRSALEANGIRLFLLREACRPRFSIWQVAQIENVQLKWSIGRDSLDWGISDNVKGCSEDFVAAYSS